MFCRQPWGCGTRGQQVPTLREMALCVSIVMCVGHRLIWFVFRLPWDVGRVGSECPPYGKRCCAYQLLSALVIGVNPVCFQAALGCGTRGQPVPTLRETALCVSIVTSVSHRLIRFVFRLPWDMGRVGSKCPPYGKRCCAYQLLRVLV